MLQTAEAVVPGSNLASLTVKNSEDSESHCVYYKISGQRGKPPPGEKKEKGKIVCLEPWSHKNCITNNTECMFQNKQYI